MIVLLLVFLPLTNQFAMLSDYGQPCNNFMECKDHRMQCKGEENNKTCVCIRYHEWKGFDQGCVQMYDGEKLMRLELFFNNISEEIARKQDKVFSFHLWAGGFVVAVYIVAILAVVLFCVYVRSADTAMDKEIYMLKMKTRRDTLMKQKAVESSV
ncbi:hypothetical protein Trydic_g19147 [Trypoxylus dichotomus]